MLTTDQRYVLNLLRRSFDIPCDEVKPENVHTIKDTIVQNGILLTVYPTIKAMGEEASELESVLQTLYFATLHQAANQKNEGKKILEGLSDAGLKCIALKGWEMSELYPKKNMRQMVDLDILVKPYIYKKIEPIMKGLGYLPEGETPWMHDNFKKGKISVEIHKRLINDNKLIQAWESEMWKRAVPQKRNVHKMSKEDYYIFHFIHLHKDFMEGSLGLRRLVDTWLLQKRSVNRAFVRAELEKFGIWKFHEKMMSLSRAVMGEEALDEDKEFLLTHAFNHGINGTRKSHKAGRIASMGGSVRGNRLKILLSAVFLSYDWMKLQFPVLEKWPVLLPVCWVLRIARFLMGDAKSRLKKVDYSDLSEEDYKEIRRFYEAGGV